LGVLLPVRFLALIAALGIVAALVVLAVPGGSPESASAQLPLHVFRVGPFSIDG
jgi:hypothetical protein